MILIFLVLVVSSILACTLEKSCIIPMAQVNFRRNSIKMMIHHKLKDMKPQRHHNKLSMHQDTNIQQPETLTSAAHLSDKDTGSSSSDQASYSRLDASQTIIVSELVGLVDKDPISKKALKGMVFDMLSFWQLFKIVYLTHHFFWGLFNGISGKYTKTTLIVSFLTHFVYVLALSMALGFGWDKSGFTSYQQFVFKCFISPILATFLGFAIKMLSKHETEYGMSFLKWCPKKIEPPTAPSISLLEAPEDRPNMRHKSTVHPSNLSKSLASKPSTSNQLSEPPSKLRPRSYRQRAASPDQPLQTTEEPTTPESSPLASQKQFRWIETEKSKPPKKSVCRRAMIYISYLLAILFVPLSFMSIYQTVAAMEEHDKEWPFGGWFAIQFVYELTIGKVLDCLFQLGLFKMHRYYRQIDKRNRLHSCTKSFCNFMLNSDIKDLMDIHDSIHPEPLRFDTKKKK